MNLRQLLIANRSYRRFQQNYQIEKDDLIQLIENTRFCASAANLQPLRYWISCDAENNRKIFPLLKWAGYLADWNGPIEGEKPSAYIVCQQKRAMNWSKTDLGIATQSILLSAVEKGLGGCMFAAFDKEGMSKIVQEDEEFENILVIALGKPIEKCVIEEAKEGNIKYYRDEQQVHHIPKRTLSELIINQS